MTKKDDIIGKQEAEDLKSVSEALKKEHAKQPKGKTHYKIFRVERDPKSGKEKKITMIKFWAKDDREAYEELKKYRKAANKAYTYYFGTTGYYVGSKLDENGNVKRYDDHEEMIEDWKKESHSLLQKVVDVVMWPFELVHDKMSDFLTCLKNTCFFFKTGHSRQESWSLDSHLVNDLIFNIPLLLKNKHGVPGEFCVKARAELHKTERGFDVEKSFEKNPNSSDEELKLAEEMWNEDLEKGLLYAKLYSFYSSYGIFSGDEWPDAKKFESEWKKTIPHVPGMYNRVDYVKLSALTNKYWNSLWNWVKDNGRNLWD